MVITFIAAAQKVGRASKTPGSVFSRHQHPDELERFNEFNHWVQTGAGPVRIHLLRFTRFEAPKAAIQALGGEFKPISLLRDSAINELLMLREVFNLIMGAGGN
jgi:hypothetical protein